VQFELKLFSKIKKALELKDIDFAVRSDSMRPLINPGDIVKVHKIESALKRFDIVVFKGQKQLLVHYIWRIIPQRQSTIFITRGINNNHPDYPTKQEDFLGIVLNYNISTFLKFYIVLNLWIKRKFFILKE
jgi:signal peptidase I